MVVRLTHTDSSNDTHPETKVGTQTRGGKRELFHAQVVFPCERRERTGREDKERREGARERGSEVGEERGGVMEKRSTPNDSGEQMMRG